VKKTLYQIWRPLNPALNPALNPVFGGILFSIILVIVFRYYYVQAVTPPSNLFSIDQMNFSAGSSPAKENRTLPDDWNKTSPNVTKGWYQINFQYKFFAEDDRDTEKLWGIYLPVLQMNARLYINDVLIGSTRKFDKNLNNMLSRVTSQPYYFLMPSALLKKDENTLKIQVSANVSGNGLLGKIYLAEDEKLHAYYDRRKTLLITSLGPITAGMLAIAVLMSVLWALRRQDQVYGWYALTLYMWSIHNFFRMGLDLTISQHAQNIISLIAFGWFIVFMVKATHYYMGQIFPWREKIILLAACGGSLMILFSSQLPWSQLITHQIWSSYALIVAGYVLLDFTIKFRECDDLQNALVLPAGFFMFVFGVHDWLLLMHLIPGGDGRLLHFAAPVTVAVFGALLLERFSGVLKRAESHNLELETRVAEKHRELESNYQRLREMENKQLLVNERERFMKEIHDGVGGHLISMLSMVRSGKRDTDIIVSSIEAALSDLRLMIDSLSPQENDIPSLLGALRTRLEPQMKDSGLNLNWQVEALPVIPDFGPHKALQVLRIVQESVTNVIRHGEAKNISIKAYAEASHVIIKICDDGKGFAEDVAHGKGLNNMHYRAKEIDAAIYISSDLSGTCITLNFHF